MLTPSGAGLAGSRLWPTVISSVSSRIRTPSLDRQLTTGSTVGPTTVLVTGATGNAGRQVVNELLSLGQQVRAITRNASAMLPAGVEVVAGGLTRPETIPFDGVTGVHLLTNAGAGYTELLTGAGLVREPFAYARSALVHEGDIGVVAAVVLARGGHDGRAYTLTGPEALTGGSGTCRRRGTRWTGAAACSGVAYSS
ncbi:SDR family oxidoreductase [Lentzea sp. HUAS TT2]|uniref:SDR family oxidoreductase n=1 Tax=Lentzea sp. HUAS TT2 TaxID=3447454 RepID=UPI003F71FF95